MKTEVQLTDLPKIRVADLRNTDHVGFILSDSSKGYVIADTDEDVFMPVRVGNTDTRPRTPNSGFLEMKSKFIAECLPLKKGEYTAYIVELFKFDDRKELYKWLSE